jgi:predicted DsbA family dithiol-disulfide isomerase
VSLQPLVEKGVRIQWRDWKLPNNANPPAKPEGYGIEAKKYLEKLLDETKLELHPPSKKQDSFLAHIGSKFALEKGIFEQYQHRVFQAVWVNNEDIGDRTVLCRIAAELGLEIEDFKNALENRKYINMVEEDFNYASNHHIWTIPSYVTSRGEIQVHHFKDIPLVSRLEEIL